MRASAGEIQATRQVRSCRLRSGWLCAVMVGVLSSTGCASFHSKHEIQGDNRTQLLLSEESQVKVRNAQSRVFDTTDKAMMLEATVATFQDLGFQVEVLDSELGIISGKKYLSTFRPGDRYLLSYLSYDEESLVVFNRVYRTWGPFQARDDMVRLTVTIRKRNAQQLIVRGTAQFALRPVEEPDAYQKFYAALQQALFTEISARELPSVENESGPASN